VMKTKVVLMVILLAVFGCLFGGYIYLIWTYPVETIFISLSIAFALFCLWLFAGAVRMFIKEFLCSR